MKKLLQMPVLWWLRFWARLVLRRVNPTIIGITGSAGKTSLRNAIKPVAKLKFKRVKVSRKANSESGIPADILGLHFTDYSPLDWLRVCTLAPLKALTLTRYHFDCYLVEMGVDEPTPPKNMGYLLTILNPQIAVILNTLPVHTQQFGDQLNLTDQNKLIQAITKEKGKLITDNPELTHAVLNADQEEVAALQESLLAPHLGQAKESAKWIFFGKTTSTDVRLIKTEPSIKGTKIILQYNEVPDEINFRNLVLPEFYGYTFAAAFATGIAIGAEPKKIAKALTDNFILPPSRSQIYRGIKNTTIIDSSYNASREPTIGSLNLLKQVAGKKTKVAVLGDMRELGNQAKTEHEAVAEVAAETADRLVLVGPLMKKFALPSLKRKRIKVDWFPTAGQATNFLKGSIKGGEIILVKGSQNTIFLEIVVEALLKNKSDITKLCRRGAFWDKQRRIFLD